MAEKNKPQTDEKSKNVHDKHRERMRARFSKNGLDGMQPHEIIEMLLFYAIPRKNTNDIAHALIDRFKTVAGVFEATENQLMTVKGVGPQAASLIHMILPLFHEYTKSINSTPRLSSHDKCGEYVLSQYAGLLKERVCLVCVDSNYRVIAFETICEGDVSSVVVDNRTLLSVIFKYPKTACVVLAHNHPGGLALPSREDILSTGQLSKMLRTINIGLLDHIIVAHGDYVSLSYSTEFKQYFINYMED